MNDLNSVLIEGTLTEDPILVDSDEGGTKCTFSLVTERTTQNGNTRASYFTVETGDRLAHNCSEYLRSNRGVRVVGYLAEDNGKFTIHAEHVEFRPFRKPNQAAEVSVAAS